MDHKNDIIMQSEKLKSVKHKCDLITKDTHLKSVVLAAILGSCSIAGFNSITPDRANYMISSDLGERRVFLAKDHIKWMQEVDKCFYICNKSDKCFMDPSWGDKYVVCKNKYPKSFEMLQNMEVD